MTGPLGAAIEAAPGAMAAAASSPGGSTATKTSDGKATAAASSRPANAPAPNNDGSILARLDIAGGGIWIAVSAVLGAALLLA